MRVFLTGGTGLLGSHLARELKTSGHEVVALHRASADASYLSEAGCELVEGDIRAEAEDLTKSMAGCSHVVHSAALVYAAGEWPKIRAVNVDGTRNVFRAAVACGVEHAVHVSSVAVYGRAEGPIDEATPIDSDLVPGDLYARSKREAEAVARGIEERHGLPVTIVRPAAVYGERDRLMVPALAGILRMPFVPLFGPGTNTVPVVYAGNVAVAIRLALEAGLGMATFDVGLDHPLSQQALMAHLAAGLGRAPRFFRLPARVVRGGAELLTRVGVGTPGAKHLPLRRVARLALGDNPFASATIRDRLGWDPPHEHPEALTRSGRWLVEN